jgi:hypothetical protein
MIDSTPLPVVVDQGPAGTTQLVVEADAGGQTEKALQNPFLEAFESASSVTLQGKDVFAGPEDRFDALPDGSQMRTFSRLVFALGSSHRSLQVFDRSGELPARVPFVAQEGFVSLPSAASKEFRPDLPLIPFGRAIGKGSRSPVCGKYGVQPHAPEVAGVAGAIPVVTEVGKSRTQRRLPAPCALDRRGVDEQEVVSETGALLAEYNQEPVKNGSQTTPTFEVAGLIRDVGKEMGKRALRPSKEPPVGWLPHDGLGHREGDALSIGRLAAGVSLPLWQKIIGRAINKSAEGVEVGVHRGLQADGENDTVDFGSSASNSFCMAMFVASVI